MAERYKQQGALAHLHLAARTAEGPEDASVRLIERPFQGQINLRGEIGDEAFRSAVESVAGLSLPETPNSFLEQAGRRALWLGPNDWLIVLADGEETALAEALRAALAGQHASIAEVGHSRTVIGLAGARAREVLRKGCSLDLHPRAFGPGQCAQTLLARADMILLQADDRPTYEINARRSFADYVWRWLEDAAREYGCALVAE